MKKNGFTLFEIIICLAIMSILAVMIYPKVTNSKSSAETSSDEMTAKILANAVDKAIDDGKVVITNTLVQVNIESIKPYINFTPKVKSIKTSGADFRMYVDSSGSIIINIYNPSDSSEKLLLKLPRN